MSYRVRYRFRVQKKLHIDDKERRFSVAGREVVLASPIPDTKILDAEWLVMNVRGFKSEEEASGFARRLKAASELSSVMARLGISAGIDKPTASFSKMVKDAIYEQEGVLLRDNVHGVDVFLDDPNVRIASITATGTVRSLPDPFLANLDELHGLVDDTSRRASEIVLLLNYALTRTDPVAQIVFAISAVEMLGQQEGWSEPQRHLLTELAVTAEYAPIGTEEERAEVALAIRRGAQKLSLRQGVFRLLASLDLNQLRKKWDSLYDERSTLVHGLAPKPGVDYSELAHKAVSLCGHILLTAIGREVGSASKHIKEFYAIADS